MSFYVYILESVITGKYYVGQTSNLEERLQRHNSGRNQSTRSGVPWELKWWKEFESRSASMEEESRIKKLKKRKGIERHVLKNGYRGVAQPGPVTRCVTRIPDPVERGSGLAQMLNEFLCLYIRVGYHRQVLCRADIES